ncbi:MAG: 3-oxoacyl-ACP reductase [Polaromonas sp.]|nr:3-oxoacyl-ACP reductase [Polaromonas sp.]
MDLGISGKRALVLGGNRGIGQGIAQALVREGVQVAITGRDAERMKAAVAELRACRPDAPGSAVVEAFALDLADTTGLHAFADKVTTAFGPIDILVNNTGGPGYGGASGRGIDEWTSGFNEMVLSVITLTDALLPGMRQRQWGRIMTVVSSGVVQPIPILGVSNTLRNALVTWSKTLSMEVAKDGITVNVLVPGRIDTERVRLTDEAVARKEGVSAEEAKRRSTSTIPMGRYGSPAEFGALAAFVAGVPASYITGSMLRCDGGNIRTV